MPREYTFAELASLSRAQTARANNWTKKGIIVGAFRGPEGRGRHQRYSLFNVLQAAVATELAELGATVTIMSAILEYLRLLEVIAQVPEAKRSEWFAQARKEKARHGKAALQAWKRIVQPELRHDINAWLTFRNPSTRPQLAFFGVTYSYPSLDPVSEAKALREDSTERRKWVNPSILAVPKGGGVSIKWWGRAAVIVNIGALLQALEKETGDSLSD